MLSVPHSHSLLFARPQCWAVPVCICWWEGRSVLPQLCFHFLCSKATGGAGDSGASPGGRWRQRGHASCHSQSRASAGASTRSRVLALNAATSYSVAQLCVASEESELKCAVRGLTESGFGHHIALFHLNGVTWSHQISISQLCTAKKAVFSWPNQSCSDTKNNI